MTITLDLNQFQAKDQNFFAEMLPYVSPAIRNIQRQGDQVSVELEERDEAEVTQKVGQLRDMILNGQLSGKEVKIKTLEDHSDAVPLNHAPIFQTLLDTEGVKEIADGVYAYSDLVLQVYRYFDRKIEAFGKAAFGPVKQYDFPVLYPIDNYEKGGYFETFPHYIMFQTTMKNDLAVLDRFAQKGTQDKTIFEEMKPPTLVLRHATCAPVYQFLSGSTIQRDVPQTYLVSGRCFRNEAGNAYELARLNEFNMKEYVFVGAPETCADKVGQAKELWHFWRDTFDLNCKVNTANDSFFASNYKKLQFFQVLGDSKQEFVCRLDNPDKEIAAASANFHRTHFSKPYNIRLDNGNFAYTACFAFGVERLTYALLCQKGLDVSKWDEKTVQELKQYDIEL